MDEYLYSATGTGIVGIARGKAYGNVIHLELTLDAFPVNPLSAAITPPPAAPPPPLKR